MPTCRYPVYDRWIDGRIVVRRDEWSWRLESNRSGIALPISEIYLDVTSWAGDRIFFFFFLYLIDAVDRALVRLRSVKLLLLVAGGDARQHMQARPGKGVGDVFRSIVSPPAGDDDD
jgi:hypothetical protein